MEQRVDKTMKYFRMLNERGCREFRDYLIQGADGDVPKELLSNKHTSVETTYKFQIETGNYKNKYEFGVYLSDLLKGIRDNEIENNSLFWNTLSLLFFDKICYRTSTGERKVQAIEKWILGNGYQHYHRHLVRSPWLFYKLYGKTSKFLLITSRESTNQLSMVNDILDQFASRGLLLRNKRVVKLFSRMYFDEEKQLPKWGLRGKEGGGPRRMGKVVRQLSLTYDLERMSEEEVIELLPKEFKRWIE